ncbi:MAG: alpha/beta hydrolase family protein [Chthonomonadales bacterium]
MLASLAAAGRAAYGQDRCRATVVEIPSPLPSGDRVNDTIWFTFYPALGQHASPKPTVILLHPLGERKSTMMDGFARFFARHGFCSAVMELPYHMHRLRRGDNPLAHYASANIPVVVQAFAQAVADVRAVTDWLLRRRDVDGAHIAVVGVSLGAIVAHTAMGTDVRLSAGVGILGGADFPYLYRSSILFRILHPSMRRALTGRERELLATVDPLTFAGSNRPRRVLMIQAARDLIIPPGDATELWQALGRPPIRWLDTNHYAPIFAEGDIHRISLAYLEQAWAMPGAPQHLPPIYAPTIKVGMIVGLDSALEPSLEWQMVSFGQWPNHTSMMHLDLGWSGRGFFNGLALTLSQCLDVGIGRRWNGRSAKPYLSLHLVF